MQNALTRLQGVSISSVPIAALPSTPSVDVVPSRTRDITRPPSGLALEGNGPRAGISGEGRTVLIQGLKPSMTEKNMRNLLVPFKLAGTNDLWKAQTYVRSHFWVFFCTDGDLDGTEDRLRVQDSLFSLLLRQRHIVLYARYI
jgi:hypothetical protein